jgi:hypothetical protein
MRFAYSRGNHTDTSGILTQRLLSESSNMQCFGRRATFDRFSVRTQLASVPVRDTGKVELSR